LSLSCRIHDPPHLYKSDRKDNRLEKEASDYPMF
jgi:hypothetical protein